MLPSVTNSLLQPVFLPGGLVAAILRQEAFLEVDSSLGASSVSTFAKSVPLDESEMLHFFLGFLLITIQQN